MKVPKITSHKTSFQNSLGNDGISPYMYLPKSKNEQREKDKAACKNHKWEYLFGFCAASLALACLMRFTVKKPPKV